MNHFPERKGARAFPLDVLLSIVIWILIALISFTAGMMFEQNKASAVEGNSAAFDLALVKKTHDFLLGNYVKSLKDYEDELLYGAMRGMVDVVHREPFNDPYSGFFDPNKYQTLEAETTGHYAGIGVRIEIETALGLPQIANVFRDSPAAEAGLKKDDYIVLVDGESVEGLSLEEVGHMIMGEEGTIVKLTLANPLTYDEREADVERAIITIHSVEEARMIAPGIAYIFLSSFQENTTEEMVAALKNLDELGMEKLILDLRGNGGGTLENAVDLASMFIPNNEVVTMLFYRRKEPEAKFADSKSKSKAFPKYDIPIILLVDGHSASASEILAGALKDHNKAILVGDKTFGKGKVQQIFEISNKYKRLALVITVAKYFTPNGRDIDGEGGIEPDIKISFDDYKEAIPRIMEIEDNVERLRNELLGYREEILDRVAERDIILERVTRDFDAAWQDGLENRAKHEADLAAAKDAEAAAQAESVENEHSELGEDVTSDVSTESDEDVDSSADVVDSAGNDNDTEGDSDNDPEADADTGDSSGSNGNEIGDFQFAVSATYA
ncbi:PDZ domain-containing protein [bacterium]|nr:PDZ domain-containing protein [bacterium]